MGTDLRPGHGLSVDRPARSADETARVLLAVQDALEAAPDAPVVLHGAGDAYLARGPLAERSLRGLVARTCDLIGAHRQPVIAAADAPLHDTGLEIALACDLRYLRRGATIGFPAIGDGGFPCGGGQRLARLGGPSLAARLLLLGQTPVAGDDPALAAVADVVDDAAAAAAAARAAIAASSPLVVAAMKTALRAASSLPLTAGLAIEADLACLLLDTADRAEGLAARQERREPRFRGA